MTSQPTHATLITWLEEFAAHGDDTTMGYVVPQGKTISREDWGLTTDGDTLDGITLPVDEDVHGWNASADEAIAEAGYVRVSEWRDYEGDAQVSTVAADIRARLDGAELKTRREALGLSGQQFAILLGSVTDRTLRRWESNTDPIPVGVHDHLMTIERHADEYLAQALAQCRRQPYFPVLETYATDAHLRAATPDDLYPASYHRAIAARVLAQMPHVRITYAPRTKR